MDNRKTVELLLAETRGEHEAIYRVFNTDDGKIMMAHLEEIFFNVSSIVPNDPYATHANEGSREVILYLKGVIENANK